jgi:hypothetical protein
LSQKIRHTSTLEKPDLMPVSLALVCFLPDGNIFRKPAFSQILFFSYGFRAASGAAPGHAANGNFGDVVAAASASLNFPRPDLSVASGAFSGGMQWTQ